MINFLLAVTLILFVIILIVYLVRIMNENIYLDDEVEETTTVTTTTTTTTVVEEPAVVTVDQLPPLERKFKENGQPYCIDPADGTEWMLNTTDDMYQDAADRWYKLV